MSEIDWAQMFGVDPEDRERWKKMNAEADDRINRGGGVDRVAEEAAKPGLNLAEQAVGTQMQAAQTAARDDRRTERWQRTVTESKTEFLDEGPELG